MQQYKKLLSRVLSYGVKKEDRTGTGTLSLFGEQMKFDLTEGFPLVTTKHLHLKSIIHELLWMISGSTNVRDLQKHGVTIWDEWAKEDGDLGPVYGAQWRSWPEKGEDWGPTIDQLADVVERLKTNPDCRRLIVSAWNPADLHRMALAPCHCLFQFYTRPMTLEQRWKAVAHPNDVQRFYTLTPENARRLLDIGNAPTRYLDLRLDQRSADIFLGVPFNIASYALLLSMVAQAVGMVPGTFIHQFGDVHLYSNHIEQAKLQLSREIWGLPQLRLNPEVKSLFDFRFEDVEILNYRSHDPIKAPVAV